MAYVVDGTVLASRRTDHPASPPMLDPCAAVGLGLGGMGQADAVFLIYTQYKAGTIGALGQAGSTPDVRSCR